MFSEKKLNGSRSSDKELKEISVPIAQAANGTKSSDNAEWSAVKIKLARPSKPETITLTSPSGEVVRDAEVVRVDDNAHLIWRRGASGGMVRLADLPADLRNRFGYMLPKPLVVMPSKNSESALRNPTSAHLK